jgi:hypothetical protein
MLPSSVTLNVGVKACWPPAAEMENSFPFLLTFDIASRNHKNKTDRLEVEGDGFVDD